MRKIINWGIVAIIIVTLLTLAAKPYRKLDTEKYVQLKMVENGVKAENISNYDLELGVMLEVFASDECSHPGEFKCHTSCILEPGKTQVLTYDNKYCRITDFGEYSVNLLTRYYDITIAAFVLWLIIVLVYGVSNIRVTASVPQLACVSAILITVVILALAWIVMALVLPCPVHFLFQGVPI